MRSARETESSFRRWAGAEVVINGQELLILSEDEILAILK